MPGRKKITINKQMLQDAITTIERSDNPPKNHAALWKAVAATDWVKSLNNGKGFTTQSLLTRAKEYGCVITTPKGIRGAFLPGFRDKPKKKYKRKKKRFTKEGAIEVAKKFKALGEKTVSTLLQGRVSSAIKAMCWDCSGGSKDEVAKCQIVSCPLHPHRPWKTKPKAELSEAPPERCTSSQDSDDV